LAIAPAERTPQVRDLEGHSEQEEAKSRIAGSGHGMRLAHTAIAGFNAKASAITCADGLQVFG